MKKIKNFYRPATIKDALKLLESDCNIVIGGGTTVSLSVPEGVTGLVSLKNIDLSQKETSGSVVRIGSGVTVQELYKWEGISGLWGGVLSAACRNVGSTLTRNLVTIGGNIVSIFPWSDLPVVLQILEGNVVVNQDQKVSFSEYFADSPVKQGYGKKKIVTGIEIEKQEGSFFWETFQKTKVDFAMSTVCGMVDVEGGLVKKLKLGVGGVSHLPTRLTGAERELTGRKVSEEVLRKALKSGLEQVKFRKDFRVSKEYISEVTENIIVKNLLKLI